MAETSFDRLSKALPPPAKAGQRRRLILVAAAALGAGVLGLAAGAGWERAADLLAPAPPPPFSVFHPIPDLTVSLRPTSSVKLMKIGVTVAVSNQHQAELAALEPVIVDGLTLYLRQLDEHDLEGAAGLERLKADLAHRVRLLAEPVPVQNVLLRTLILQ